jgi:hypothetical protein
LFGVTIWNPKQCGIKFEAPSGVVNADQVLRNIRITNDVDNNLADGIYIGTGINGTTLYNLLINGGGLKNGIVVEGGGTSGLFLDNLIIDDVGSDGLKILSTTSGIVGMMLDNSWIVNSKGFGINILGSSTVRHYHIQISNSQIWLSRKAGVRLEYARLVSFSHCVIRDNFLGNESGVEYDTNVLIKGGVQAVFNDCWFGWDKTQPSNRGKVVRVQITSDNPNPITVKFDDCLFWDIADSTRGRIGYGRDTATRELRIYLRDAFVKDSTRSYDDLVDNGATGYEEVDTKLGAAFTW